MAPAMKLISVRGSHPLQPGRFDRCLWPDQQHLVADLRQQILLARLLQGLVDGPLLGPRLRA